MQKVMIVHTRRDDMRAEIDGWTCEDGNEVVKTLAFGGKGYETVIEVPVGVIRNGRSLSYPTVLHALGDGWKLLSPPQNESKDILRSVFVWWLVKD